MQKKPTTKKPSKKPTAKKRKPGRPSLYTPKITGEILRQLHESDGDELPKSLRQICRDSGMPTISTVMEWLKDYPEFSERYARARELRKDALVDRMLSLAAKAKSEAYGEPGTGEAGAKVAAYKIEIDTIKWVLSKEYARDYGDLLKQEISGPDGGPLENVLSITPEVEARIKRLASVRDAMIPPHGYEKPHTIGPAET
jgi:hypothetical protein